MRSNTVEIHNEEITSNNIKTDNSPCKIAQPFHCDVFRKDAGALRSAYDLIVKGTSEETASDTRCFGPPELYVLCAEQALQVSTYLCEGLSFFGFVVLSSQLPLRSRPI